MSSGTVAAPKAFGADEKPVTRLQRTTKVGMISLGCAKNLVDAEIMLGSVLQRGMEITSHPEDADVLVVNTCAFIDSAKEESIGAILEAHQQRGLSRRPDQKLIVSGCMSQRFATELRQEMPEVDAFIGLDQVNELGRIVERILGKRSTPNVQRRALNGDNDELDLSFADRRPTYIPDYDTPRFRLTPAHFAYVKIAEGCNHPCSFCVIPQMRGKHRSRTPQSVIAEIRSLVSDGVREINLISQDTTYYGMDLWPTKAGPRQPIDSTRGPTLAALLHEIQQIEGEFWVRLLYTHPAHWSDELIKTIAHCDKVARYVDIPLQHIDHFVLQRMRRETSRAHIENLIHKLRAGIPGLTLRTTFIVGFPGETDAEFAELLDFIRCARFERLGIFKYSHEEGSRAAKMPGQIPAKIKNARYRATMSVQQAIAHELARQKIGAELKLLVEQPHIARSEGDAPDVDARVVLSKAAPVGEFIWRRITATRGYDLLA
ncbi:MAG TPA: 30S ribosomal protein S12 methylthiotransferase RimO [Candidatus Limnocylindria bacterium]|nr:30S ribosomal protein S12 methylthiotransferase RimO [Candidatus Limnocylindria bacterium]